MYRFISNLEYIYFVLQNTVAMIISQRKTIEQKFKCTEQQLNSVTCETVKCNVLLRALHKILYCTWLLQPVF